MGAPDLPEIASATALNEAAAINGWPMLCDESCDFTSSMLPMLLNLWSKQKAVDGIPARQALTANLLQPYMGSLTIYERLSDGARRRYRIRLMGSDVVHVYGELTGKFLDETVPERFLPAWYALADVALAAGRPMRVLLRLDSLDKSYMVAEYLCAPLRADGGLVKFLLAAVQFDARRPWSVVEAEARHRLGMEPADTG